MNWDESPAGTTHAWFRPNGTFKAWVRAGEWVAYHHNGAWVTVARRIDALHGTVEARP